MRKSFQRPEVILVGAGPGDPELISLKGVNAIKKANVILYDALCAPELLTWAALDCKLVYVGKRKNQHAFTQEEINQLIVFYAYRYGRVVRLKGGDPYVFGRGHEELDYARRRGLEVKVVPGISSALSAPAAVGIPLTKRGVNESFWVITGSIASGELSSDIKLAAQSSATVVILMGMSNLKEIMKIFSSARHHGEPAAIIENATLPQQKFLRGTVHTLPELVEENGIGSPAVIVIGKVVEETVLESVCENLIQMKR